MYYVPEDEKKQYDYITYPRQFITYRWYKPLITTLLFVVFSLAMLIIIVVAASMTGRYELGMSAADFIKMAKGGYDTMDLHTVTGVITNIGAVVVMLPALMLARAIVRDRTWSSYASSRGGWDMGLFIKCLVITLFVIACPIVGRHLYLQDFNKPDMGFSRIVLLLILILGPLQCITEEFIFRGLFLQTLGSWFRNPVIAIVLASGAFVLLHPYNLYGKISVFISGMTLGLAVWIGRGLEASSAMHISNNLTIFIMEMLRMTESGGEVGKKDLIFSLIIELAYVLILLILSKKTRWFDTVRKNDAEIFNSKINAKRAAKAQKRARKGGGNYSIKSQSGDSYADPQTAAASGAENSSAVSAETAEGGNAAGNADPASSYSSQRSGRSGRSGSYQGKHFKH